MEISRRDLTLMASAVFAAGAKAEKAVLPAHAWAFDNLPVKVSGENKSRNVLDGLTHSGFHIDLHLTELAPGKAPHPAHHHEHEEMVMIQEGTLEVTIDGKVTNIGPGGVAYVASNLEHGWRNIGTTRANYFVLALGKKV
jgi:quercetin dioxygenase-like cupin family protein